MPSSNEILSLAKTLQKAGLSINKRVNDNLFTLKHDEIQELLNRAQELFIKSKTLFEQGAIEIGNESSEALKNLNNAKDEISNAIKTIEKVQNIINISAKLISLASSVLTGDIGQIASISQEVVTLVTS